MNGVKTSEFSLTKARSAALHADYMSSAKSYLLLIRFMDNEERLLVAEEFCPVLRSFLLNPEESFNDRLMVFTICLEVYPDHSSVLNILAKFLFSIHHSVKALELVQHAIHQSEGQARLESVVNHENIKSNIMDQWHWAMLNDENRNLLYGEAISCAVNAGSRVLDLGGGTGLLSMIARRCSTSVFYCEVDPNMCSLAEVVTKNSDIAIIRKHSTNLQLCDIGSEKINVLVTETMDSGLFGESIVSSVLDAHHRFLSENCVVIPRKATLHVCLIESESVRLENMALINGSCFTSKFVQRGEWSEYIKSEPYTCFYMEEMSGGYTVLTDSQPIISIDFGDVPVLEMIYNGSESEATLKCLQSGSADAIMAWFECELYGGVPTLCTSPSSKSCWQQAIYILPVKKNVHTLDSVKIKCKACKNQVVCTLVDADFVDSNVANSTPMNTCDSVDQFGVPPNYEQRTSTDECDFLFLNDQSVISLFTKSSLLLTVDISSKCFIDITDVPSISLAMLSTHPSLRVIYFYEEKIFRSILETSDAVHRITFSNYADFPHFCDVVFCWPIGSAGNLCSESLNRMLDLKLLNPDIIFVPSHIVVRAQLVSCPIIGRRSRPNRRAHQNVDLSVLDNLAIKHYYDVEPSTMIEDFHSEEFDLVSLQFNEILRMDTNILPNFIHQFEVESSVMVIKVGGIDGILYWFDVHSNGSPNYIPKSSTTLARCAVHLFDECTELNAGCDVKFKTSLFHGNLVIECDL